MANGIKIGNLDISAFKVGSSDCKVYLGDTLLYPQNQPIDYANEYLTLVAETDNVSFAYTTATSSNKLQYSLDSGSTWSELGNNQSTTSVNSGQKVMFKASGLTVNTERGVGKIIPSASVSVEGNIMSLAYGDNFSGQTVVPNNFQFRKLFSGVTTITSAENMVLPATTIKKQCYSQMFQGCTSLTTAPTVIGSSAMTWSGDYCWSDMFNTCTSLVNPPQLPALNLGSQCYWYMFQNCTSLETAPVLSATTLANNCYNSMFYGCTSLNSITCLATNISASNCTNNWVNGVSSSGTFTKAASMSSWTEGNNGIPSGWTVQNA